MTDKRNKMNECWDCKNTKEVPGSCHIGCSKPDAKMTGHAHGIKNGWFYYPECFDPTWKTKDCDNFEKKQ